MTTTEHAQAALLLFGLYNLGFFTAHYFLKNLPSWWSSIIALPIGVCSWALIWIIFRISTKSNDFGMDSLANTYSLIASALWLALFFTINVVSKNFRDWRTLAFWILPGLLLTIFAFIQSFFSGKLFLSGDSYIFINWSSDPGIQLQQGFPLVNLAIANLSTLVRPNFYLASLHPALALSFLVFLYLSIVTLSIKMIGNPPNPLVSSLVPFFLIALFGFSEMFLMQMVYVNHHVIAAFLIMIMAVLLFLADHPPYRYSFFIGILLLFLSLSRVEGFLYGLLLAVLLAFSQQKTRFGIMLIGFSLVLPASYVIFLAQNNWVDGFVKGWHYAFMLLIGSIAWLTYCSSHMRSLFRDYRLGLLLTTILLLVAICAIVYKPAHMLISLFFFTMNFFTPQIWGGSTVVACALGIMLIYLRTTQKDYWKNTDILLLWFACAILLLFSIVVFRTPLRQGMFDSATRITFHFIPILILWVGIELTRQLNHLLPKNSSA